MIPVPDVVRNDLYPESIRILYMKMQLSLSMRGVLEGLKEILEELEWKEETSVAYGFYLNRVKEQEKKDAEYIKDGINWIGEQLKSILQELSKNQNLKNLIEPHFSERIKAIRKGQVASPTHLQALTDLLEETATIIANFGEEKILKNIGTILNINVSLPANRDPLEHVKEEIIVEPFSILGEKIRQVLGKGFIRARVLPPTQKYQSNRYFIDQGFLQINWPESIKKIRKINLVDWRITFDASASRCLHALLCYSAWRDWLMEHPITPNDHSKSKDIDGFYIHRTMKEHITDVFSSQNFEFIRSEIFSVLNRFLSVLLYEKIETRGKNGNKNRAEKYAYKQIKAILLQKTMEERKSFNNSIITDMIMERAQEEDLTFKLTETNCIAACRMFESKYGWEKKRQKDTKPRGKRVL